VSLIHILDKKTDEIIGTLNFKNAEYKDAIRRDSLENENIFNFIANSTLDKSSLLEKRNRLLIQDEDGFFCEYIIVYAEKYSRTEKDVKSVSSFGDLAKAKVIDPQVLQGATSASAVTEALFGTEWQPGNIEFTFIRTITIAEYTNPLALLKTIASTFELEIGYRIEISGNRIVGRYVDMKKQIAGFEGKEIVFGKDLVGVRRKEDGDGMVTALLGIGPENEGIRLTTLVEDIDALQRWGRGGKHLIEAYEPESSDADMTLERLHTLTENELEKRIDAIVTYEGDAVSLEHIKGLSHEKIRVGQTVRIKDDGYKPPLYLEARIQDVEVDQATHQINGFKIGNFIEFKKADLEAQISLLKALMTQKLTIATQKAIAYTESYSEKKKILSDTPPEDTAVIWVKPDAEKNVNIAHAHDGTFWVPITTTSASDIVEGIMLLDRVVGGSLKLGLSYGNGVLEVWADTDGDGQQEQVGRIDSTGSYFPLMFSDDIKGNVENILRAGSINYYFDTALGDDGNDGLSWGSAKKNIQAFIDSLPKNLNNFWVQLNFQGILYGGIRLDSFHNGDILCAGVVDGAGNRPQIFGQNAINRCTRGRFLIQSADSHGDSSTEGRAINVAYNSDYAQFYSVKVYGNDFASHAFWFDNCKFKLGECHVYDIADRGLYVVNMSQGYVLNCKGSAIIAMLVTDASVVNGTGTRWGGSVVRANNALLGAPGADWNNDPWVVDTGEATPPAPAPATEKTLTVTASTGDNWGDMYGWANGEVRQGNYGYGTRRGIWYLDLSVLRGKTIVSATITLYRGSGGASAARTVYFRTHPYKTRAERSAGAPALSGVGATTTMAVGQTKTVDITAMVRNNIANASDNSIGVYTTGSTDYMSLGTQPNLVIRYK
jgi:phage minor structural protein